jgi:hypothetical protein
MVCAAEQRPENALLRVCGRLPLGLGGGPLGEPAADRRLDGAYGRNCWAIFVTWPCATVIQNGGVPEFGK